jgi:long-subunit fatty acid transport protein
MVTTFSANARSITFGPKLGVNIDKFNTEDIKANFKDACGFTGGVTAEYMFPIVGLGVDLSVMYTHMTAKMEVVEGVEAESIKQDMLEIPLNLKYKISLPVVGSFLSPYVFTGPTLALRLAGNYDNYDWGTTQWGWNVGIGVEVIKHLQIGASYTFGLNNTVKSIWDGVYDSTLGQYIPVTDTDFKIRNNYWTITAAWLF